MSAYNGVGRGITRNRERLVCTECRRRKLKCDRSHPCSACVRRGVAEGCRYQPRLAEQSSVQAARLENLERVVQQLVSHSDSDGAPQRESPGSGLSHGSTGVGGAGGSDGGSVPQFSPDQMPPSSQHDPQLHRGSTHWSSVLEDIQALKAAFSMEDIGEEEEEEDFGLNMEQNAADQPALGILFGSGAAPTLQSLLEAYLPPKQEVDRLMAAYFRAQSIAAPFIHSKQFTRMYAAFWADPLNTPPLWVSLVFSICYISINVKSPNDSPNHQPQSRPTHQWFAQAAAHCLTIGEYFRPNRYAVDALLLFVQAHCLTNRTLPPDLAPVLGTVVRVATAMGYHDERSAGARNLSPFEAEMRSRRWSLCMQLDLLVSFNLGLPAAMSYTAWPREPPRNLRDDDFDEDSAELPPSRPADEPTGMLLVTIKHRFMVIFDKIQQHALASSRGTSTPREEEEQLAALDAELRSVHDELPPALHARPMEDSIFDSPAVIVTRLCVNFMFWKCLVVLHRPYAVVHSGACQVASLRACHAAAAALVGTFCNVVAEFAPGGQAETERWFMASLTWHDVLLAATALCLVALAGARARVGPDVVDVPAAMDLLERADGVVATQEATRCKATARVREVMAATLKRLRTMDQASWLSLGEEGAGSVQSVRPMDWEARPFDAGDSLWEDFLGEYVTFDTNYLPTPSGSL